MTATTDFDRLVASWLDAAGPTDIAGAAVEVALSEARRTRRRQGIRAAVTGPRPWPATSARRVGRVSLRLAIVVGLLALAIFAAVALFGGARPSVPLANGVLAIADDAGLTIAGPNGADPRHVLAEGPAFDPRWSPDGAFIAVLVGGGRLQTLVVVRPDGTVVGRSTLVKEFRWLGQLLLVRRESNVIDVLQEDLDLAHRQFPIDAIMGARADPLFEQPLADALAVRHDHASGATVPWGGSPQRYGTITFVTFSPGHGSSTGQVVTAGTDVRAMVWSPSEDRLAFIDTICDPTTPAAACAGTLGTIANGGTDWASLVGSISAVSEPVWDAAGHRLLATQLAGGQTDIVLVDIRSTGVTRLTRDPAPETAPRWAADVGRVLFLRDRATASGTAHDAWTVLTDGSAAARIAVDVNGADWRPTP